LTIKTLYRRSFCLSNAFVVNFDYCSPIVMSTSRLFFVVPILA